MIDGDPLARLSAFLRSASVQEAVTSTGGRVIGVGWATVELDRAVVELGAALRIQPERFARAAASVGLGAHCLVAADVLEGGLALAVVEPNTEGRLAGTLARHGEGPVAMWLAVDRLVDTVATVAGTGRPTSPSVAGPFGIERLVLDGPIHGPHLFLIERAGTIRA